MKKINHLISALIVAAMTAGFASCSSSDDPSSVSDNTPKELTLTIMSTKPVTKAALSSDPSAYEKDINRITVGIFSSDGSEVRTIQEFYERETTSDAGIAGTNKFYNATNGAATVKVVTTKMTVGDKVAIAINAPANKFNSVSTLAGFNAVLLDADNAIARDASGAIQNDPQSNNIPMYGEANAKLDAGTNYKADVNVYHITAKVTLESLSVKFASDGPYSAASFTPEEIFLYSVPDGVMFKDGNQCATSTFLTGQTSVSGSKTYLTSGNISTTALSGTADMTGKYYFYTTPNNDTDNKTKLVIKGNFKADGTGAGEDVYYPVKLNYTVKEDGTTTTPDATGTQYVVSPNKNYKCTVVIKTKGVSDPSSDIDPTTATITINVASFTDVSQETVFQ